MLVNLSTGCFLFRASIIMIHQFIGHSKQPFLTLLLCLGEGQVLIVASLEKLNNLLQ